MKGRYAERYATTGEVRPFVRRNGPTRELNEFEEHFLANLVLAKSGIYLRELQEELCDYATLGTFLNNSSYSASNRHV